MPGALYGVQKLRVGCGSVRVARVVDGRDWHGVYDVDQASRVVLICVAHHHGVERTHSKLLEVGDHLVSRLSRSAIYEDVTAIREPDQDAATLDDV